MLYIATHNRHKFDRLKSLISSIDSSLEIRDIFGLKIDSPEETGLNEKENAFIKANYYHSILQDNLIVEDNGLYFDGININDQPGHKLKDKFSHLSYKEKLNAWREFFVRNNISSGILRYVYVLFYKKNMDSLELNVPISINFSKLEEVSMNPLSCFIGPFGGGKSFNDLSNEELIKYRIDCIKPSLQKLFIKVCG